VEEPVDLVDLAPTLRAAAGLPAVTPCDGEDVLARISTSAFRETFWADLVRPDPAADEGALRTGRWKLMQKTPSWELYDLDEDPGERRNLLAADASATIPESFRVLLRRFEHERATWEARRDALLPDAVELEQEVSEEVRRRLQELGYATDEAGEAPDPDSKGGS